MKIDLHNNTTKEVVNMKFDIKISLDNAKEVHDMKRLISDMKAFDQRTQESGFQGYGFQHTFLHFLEEEFMKAYNNPDIIELLEKDKK